MGINTAARSLWRITKYGHISETLIDIGHAHNYLNVHLVSKYLFTNIILFNKQVNLFIL